MPTDYGVEMKQVALLDQRIDSVAVHRQLMLCRRIRGLRESAGLTQNEVAEHLGVSQAAYCRLEKGEIEISLTRMIALGELFGASLHQLLAGL
jgi:DNA-binding XRE family transcriptional regulator